MDTSARPTARFGARRLVDVVLAAAMTVVVTALLDLAASAAWPNALSGDLVQLRPRLAPSLKVLLEDRHRFEELAFTFQPSGRTRMVRVVFGLDHEPIDDDFAVLSLSAIPAIPSRVMWIEPGHSIRTVELPDVRTNFEESTLRVRLQDGTLHVDQDGREAAAVAFEAPPGPVHLALYPSYPMAYLRPDYHVLGALTVRWRDHGGAHQRHGWTPWRVSLARPVILAAAAVLLFRRLRRRNLRRPAGLLGTGVLVVLLTAIVVQPRWCPAGDEQSDYIVDGVFDARRFATLHGLDVPTGKPRLTVIAFGGSTTAGDPFEPNEGFDYPARLERLLHDAEPFRERTVKVVNAGKVGVPLTSIDDVLASIVDATRPRVVTLSSVYNNAFNFDVRVDAQERMTVDLTILTLVKQVFGRPARGRPVPDAQLRLYEAGLRCFADVAAANGVQPIWIEEPIDVVYFGGANPLEPLQQVLRRVAEEKAVPLIRLQDDFDRDRDRLHFYEYIHLTSLGNELLAKRLGDWFTSHAQELVETPSTSHATVLPDAIDSCRDLAAMRR